MLTSAKQAVYIGSMEALTKAIEHAGGVAALAKAIGCSPQVICNWRIRGQVPPERCMAVETATGGAVTRGELRPDVFGQGATA